MDEPTHRRWDVMLKILGAVAGTIVFFVGVDRYAQEQRAAVEASTVAEERARERTFLAELFKQDLDTLGAIAAAASTVAVSTHEAAVFEEAAREYEQLYWGNVVLEEDPELVGAMDALRNAIRFYREGYVAAGDSRPDDQLKRRAHQVSLATRRAVQARLKELKQVQAESADEKVR